MTNICRDCKYILTQYDRACCSHEKATLVNMVSGNSMYADCETMRISPAEQLALCGREGTLYEPKPEKPKSKWWW